MKCFIAFLACYSLAAAFPEPLFYKTEPKVIPNEPKVIPNEPKVIPDEPKVHASEPKFYTNEEIKLLATFSEDLNRKKAENFVDQETSIRTAPHCIVASDCAPNYMCQDMLAGLEDMVNLTTHRDELPRLRHKAKIIGKECIISPAEVVNKFSPEQLGARLQTHIDEINSILGNEENGVLRFGMDVNALATKRVDVELAMLPMQRVGTLTPFDPSSILYLVFALRGMDGSPDIDDSLALILALSSVQQPGTNIDNDLFNNPFLLFTLLGNKDSSSSKDVLLYSLLLSPNGGLGAGSTLDPANTFSNPLILLSLLEKNDGNMNIKDLLPLLLIGQGGAHGAGGPGGLSAILPLLLLSSNSSDLGGDKLLPLLLLGGLGGVPGSDPHAPGGLGLGAIEQLLPLLLSSDSNSTGGGSLNDILPLLLLGGGAGGAGLGSILPLLLLQGNSSSIGSDNNFALLLALSGGLGGAGGLESILPLLLFKDSSSGGSDKDLLSLLALLGSSGGLGGPGGSGPGASPISNILPLLLLLDSGSDNMILILYIFGFLTAVPDPLIAG